MNIIKIKFLVVATVMLCSCEKIVEVGNPENFLISSTVFESNETATSAVTGIYATMMDAQTMLSYNLALFTGIYGDELKYSQSDPGLQSMYKYTLIAKDALTNTFWNVGFSYIYQANAAIEGLNRSERLSKPVKDQLLGEALFIRSFWNYYLSIFYGSLPLVTTTDYEVNSKLGRVGVEVIQKQIVDDLTKAKELLGEKYVAGNSVSESMDRIRPNTFVVSALLARVYLLMDNYVDAEAEATRIITNEKYSLSEITQVFKRTSKEVIWQLELPENTGLYNSYEAAWFPLTAKPGPGTLLCSSISDDLLALFEPADKRRASWIGTYLDNTVFPSEDYFYPIKLNSTSAPSDEYTTPFRLAEIYLVRAEARAKLGLIFGSINDADKIRGRAGINLLEDINPNIDKPSLLDSIQNERRRELFCEWGMRWADIRRNDNANEIMTRIAAGKEAVWTPWAIVWPIPLNEILNSAHNLKQNEGYN